MEHPQRAARGDDVDSCKFRRRLGWPGEVANTTPRYRAPAVRARSAGRPGDGGKPGQLPAALDALVFVFWSHGSWIGDHPPWAVSGNRQGGSVGSGLPVYDRGWTEAMPVDHVNGVDLYWEHRGSGPRLLFCNGSGTTLQVVRPLLDSLSGKFDLPAGTTVAWVVASR